VLTIRKAMVTREQVCVAFRRTPDGRLRARYHWILLAMDGRTSPGVAQLLYRGEETIRTWVHGFNEAGLPGLERASKSGRPTRLTPEQRTQVQEAVRRCPRDVGYHASLWTTKVVRHLIYTRFGIEYCRERVRQLLHALGFRLCHRHLKAKAEEQVAFRTELRELLAEWPEEWELIFVDEATMRRHPTLTVQWCLADEVPEVPTGADHTKVHIYGTVAPLPGRTHYHVSPELGKEEFVKFRQHLMAYDPGKRLPVIHDWGAQHKGSCIAEVVREARGQLVLKARPAYSPELNPQERI
jgi:transposase